MSQIINLNEFTANNLIEATKHNENFSSIKSALNDTDSKTGYSATDYGSSLDSTTINSAISSLGTEISMLVLTQGNWSIDSNVTVPDNIELVIKQGAILTIAYGATLIINGSLKVPSSKVFQGTGIIDFGKKTEKIEASWFGTIGDGTADDTQSLSNASKEGNIIVPKGTHNVEKTDGLSGKEPCVQQVENSTLIGIDKNKSILEAITGSQPVLGIPNDNEATQVVKNVNYKNLTVKANSASAYSDCIHIQYTDDYKVENCNLQDAGRDGIYIGSPLQAGNPLQCDNGIIENCKFTNNGRWDVSFLHGENLYINNNKFETGVDVEPTTSTAYCGNIKILNNTINTGTLQIYNTKRNNDGTILNLTGTISADSNSLSVSDASNLEVGEFIAITDVTPNVFEIIAINGTTLTLDKNADAAGTSKLIKTFLQLKDVDIKGNLLRSADSVSYGAIRLFLATHLNINENRIYNCDGDGISMDRVTHSNICNNKIMRDPSCSSYGEDIGIYLTRSQNKAIGNTIWGYSTGIRNGRGINSITEYQPYQTADYDVQNIISNNHIKVQGNIGVWNDTQSDKSTVIADNIIERIKTDANTDTNSAGIYVKSVGTIIKGNQVKGNFYYGIRLFAESEDCIVEDNNINGVVGSYITDAGVHNKINGYYYSATTPTTGTWIEGDMIKQNNHYVTPAWACTQSGTCGTLSGITGSTTSGSNVLTLNDTAGLRPMRNFITIAGITGSFEIIKLEGTTAYLNKTADTTVTDASVSFSNPTFTT